MKDFNEVKDYVKKRRTGTALYGTINGDNVYLSRGIREVFFEGDNIQKIIDAVCVFQKGDLGSSAEHGKKGEAGHEYGRYEICELAADEGDDNAVWIHRDHESVIVYFKFER